MEDNKSDMGHDMGHGEYCHCHGHGFGHRFVLLRWILGIIILGMVFCLGMMIGQFRGAYGDSFGGYGGYGHHGMMRYQQPMPMMYYGNQGMMGTPQQSPAQSAPATPTK